MKEEEDDEEEEEAVEEEGKETIKIYLRDHDKMDMDKIQEETKIARNKGIVRVTGIQEEKLKQKLEEQKDLKLNLIKWSKSKSKIQREEPRKL